MEFCIPIRIDSPDRAENLSNAVKRIEAFRSSSNMSVVTTVVEMDERSSVDPSTIPNARHIFIKSNTFAKSQCVNLCLQQSRAEFFCIYDADVILSDDAIREAVRLLRRDCCSIVIPFNKLFLEAERGFRSALIESDEVEPSFLTIDRRSRMFSHPDVHYRFVSGGAAIARKDDLLMMGGLNRKMISYGGEDVELLLRARIAGFGVRYLSGYNLIHLAHRRGEHSIPNPHTAANIHEMERVKRMGRSRIRRYIREEVGITVDHPGAGAALERRFAELSRFDVTRLRHLRNMLNIGLRARRFKLAF